MEIALQVATLTSATTMLTLKRTDLPSKPTDDYEVFDDRKMIGRIMLTRAASRDTPWFWSLFRGHGPQSQADKGYAETRAEAMAAFKVRWLAKDHEEFQT